jgi:hypothetical protein
MKLNLPVSRCAQELITRPGASADVLTQSFLNRFFDLVLSDGTSLKFINQDKSSHEESRGRVSTLEGVLFEESFLQEVQFAILGQTFNSFNLTILKGNNRCDARLCAVESHFIWFLIGNRASLANANATANFFASETQVVVRRPQLR